MDAGLAWTIVGSIAGVGALATGVVFGVVQLRQGRGKADAPAAIDQSIGANQDSDVAVLSPPATLQPKVMHGQSKEVITKTVPQQIVIGEIPQQPMSFQPRSELQASFTALSSSNYKIFVVTGPRGVGKSQLAGAIARRRLAEGWRVVAWISAEDESQLMAGFGQLAAELGLRTTDLDPKAVSMRVRHWLESDGSRCLLVLDNAINAELVRPFLPVAGGAVVIITSFRQTLSSLGTPVVVDVFTPGQASAFLIARTGRNDVSGGGGVAADLGYLPLALAQAASVISGQNLEYATYRDRLAAVQVTDYLTRTEEDPYPMGTAEAIVLSMSAIEVNDPRQTCRQILELSAVLAPDGIPRNILYAAAKLTISLSFNLISIHIRSYADYSLIYLSDA